MPAKCGSSPRENVGMRRSTIESAPCRPSLQAAGDLLLPLRRRQRRLGADGERGLGAVVVVQLGSSGLPSGVSPGCGGGNALQAIPHGSGSRPQSSRPLAGIDGDCRVGRRAADALISEAIARLSAPVREGVGSTAGSLIRVRRFGHKAAGRGPGGVECLVELVAAFIRTRAAALRNATSRASRTDNLSRASKVISGTSSLTASAQRTSARLCESWPLKRLAATTNGRPAFSK